MKRTLVIAATLVGGSCALAGPALDPIDALARKLNSDRMWPNGEVPIISLSSNAAPKEVVGRAVKMWGFDRGHIKTFEIVEIRKIRLDAKPDCSAAVIRSDLGRKILLFRYESHQKMNFGWTRFYDVPKEAEPCDRPNRQQSARFRPT